MRPRFVALALVMMMPHVGVMGPHSNNSGDDIALLTDFLAGIGKGVWIMGDGFAENSDMQWIPQQDFLNNVMGATLRSPYYLFFNQARVADLIPRNPLDDTDIYGVRNTCEELNDVLAIAQGAVTMDMHVAMEYEPVGTGAPPHPALPFTASLYKAPSGNAPWTALLDGWDISSMTSRFDLDTKGRHRYFYNVFTRLFPELCDPTGIPLIALDVPTIDEGRIFFALGNNPLRSGDARLHLGLTKSDRVTIKVYDVSGRLVRTLADRLFPAGVHELVWDGYDNAGKPVPRGVYFTQARYLNSKFTGAKKLIVLK